jgi:acyl dehydratase
VSLSAQIVDYEFRPLTHDIDTRWLMGFCAAIGDARDEFFDTNRPSGIVAHPLFSLALEWPAYLLVVRELIGLGLGKEDAMLATPIDHEVTLYRSIWPGHSLTTIPAVRGVQASSGGAIIVLEMTSTRANGALVARSTSRVLFPGVALAGSPIGLDPRRTESIVDLRVPDPLSIAVHTGTGVEIKRGRRRLGAAAAHVFGECSGMWNPLHTDRAVALDAGLAGFTIPPPALLSMAVSSVMQLSDIEPMCVRRIRGEFGARVPLPGVIDIETTITSPASVIGFRVGCDAGKAITNGTIVVEDAPIDPIGVKPMRETRPTALRWHRAKSKF